MQFETLEIRSLLAHSITIETGGATSLPAGATAFSDTEDYTLDPSAVEGGNVVLEANTDVTFQSSVYTNYNLTVRAGRSIIDSSGFMIAYSQNLTFIADDTTADGVSSADRDSGAATISDAGSGIYAYAGNVTMTLNTGAGLTNSTSGNISITSPLSAAATMLVQNYGPTAGSSIVDPGLSVAIAGATATFDVNGAGGGGSIGTASAPLDVATTTLSARSQSGGAFFNAGDDTLTIGSAGGLIGISTSSGGAILLGGEFGDAPTLTISSQINAGSGSVFLSALNNLSETTAGSITAGALDIELASYGATGNIVLEQPNNVATLAASNTTAGGAFSFNDAAALTLGTVTSPNTSFVPTQLGITTSSGDVNLLSTGLAIDQPISAGTGTLRLAETGAVSQASPGTITAAQMSVRATSPYSPYSVLLSLTNHVTTTVAARWLVGRSFTFTNSGSPSTTATVAAASPAVDPANLFPALAGEVQVSNAAIAQPNGPEFQVNTYTAGSQLQPKVAADAAGDYVVVWASYGQDGSRYGIYAQRYNAAGAAQGSEFRVNTYTTLGQSHPAVAMDSAGDFVVAWQSSGQDGSGYGIYAQRYNAAGAVQGSEFRVNTYASSTQAMPTVAMDSAGDFVIAYQSNGPDGSSYGIFAQRYNSASVAQGGEFQVNTYTTGTQDRPAAAMDSAGDFVITWESSGQDGANFGIYAQRYNTAGAAQGSEFQVNTYTTGFQARPAVAMDSLGDFVITWTSLNGADASLYGVYARRYNAAGVAQSTSEFLVNTYTKQYQWNPAAAMDLAGDFVITWVSAGEDGSGYGMYAQRYDSSGTRQGEEFRVNTYTTGNQGNLGGGAPTANFGGENAVAMDAAGDFIVAWASEYEDGSGYGIYAQRYIVPSETSVSSVGSEFQVNTYTFSGQANARIASDASGDYVIAWVSTSEDGSSDGIYAQLYNAAGVPQGSEFRVNTYTTANQEFAAVAMDAAGDFVVTWTSGGNNQDGNGYGVFAQRYNAAGVKQGSEFRVNTYTTGNQGGFGGRPTTVAMDSIGDFVVVWQSYGQDGDLGGIYAQRYNSSGAAQGSEYRVNTYTTNSQLFPSVAMDAAGDLVIAWQSKYQDGSLYGIYAQVYNAAGTALGSEFRVNSYTTNDQLSPTVAMDSAGDFVVSWQSNEDGSSFGIYAQRYNLAGAPQGTEFRVNSYTTNGQRTPSVALDSAGDFLVTWMSYGQDGSGYGVYAQRYNATGAAQGSEFQINTYTPGGQGRPVVAMDSTGDSVIAWQSQYQDGSQYGIYAQRYSALTPPVVTTTGGALSYTGNSGAQAIDPGLTLADGESTVITSATVSISSGYINGEDVLGFTNQNGIAGTFTPASGLLVLTGTASVAEYQTALESVTYTDAQNDSSTASRTVSFVVNDGLNSSNVATKTVNPQVYVAATFTDLSPSLNLALNTNAQVSIISVGTSYTLTLASGVWSGTDDANVSGNGTGTLTVTNSGISAFTNGINITDTGSTGGDSVAFGNSGTSAYFEPFNITLTNSTSTNGLSFNGASTFSSSSTISASVSGSISVNAGATINIGSVTLFLAATGSNASLTDSGTIISQDLGVILEATGAVTVAAGATINSGTGWLTLAADITSAGVGDDGVGTLSINAGATVTSSDSFTGSFPGAITLRGADISIDTSSNPAVIGERRTLGTTASAVYSAGLSQPADVAFDSSGNLYVANYLGNTVSEFAPGSTTASFTYSVGMSHPHGLAFDSSGNLYVANTGNSTVEEFTPGNSSPTQTYSAGISAPQAIAFDSAGDLYVANATTVSKFAPGSTIVSATYSAGSEVYAIAFDSSGNLYLPSYLGNTVEEFAPGSTTAVATYTGFSNPDNLVFDNKGNLYVANAGNSTVSKFAPGSTTASAVYTAGLATPHGLAIDSAGDLYVGNYGNTNIIEYLAGSTTPASTLTGANMAEVLAFDAAGNLYSNNAGNSTVTKYSPSGTTPTAGGVVIQSSVESRPMLIGGTNSSPVAGINLTSAELAQIFTTSAGTVTIGDTPQTGNITFSTATPATTAGASLNVIQSTSGGGQIILDDGAGTATALNGNGGNISLTAGTGGIVALAASNSTAEIATTGANVTLLTSGPIGTSTNRIQFADNANTAQQIVSVGSPSAQPSSVYLDGLGSLTLGTILGNTATAAIDVTARTTLLVAAGSTINSGTGPLSLGADLNANKAGNDGVGALSISAGVVVISSNTSANAITLRGADVNIDTSANPALVEARPQIVTTTNIAYQPNLFGPSAMAIDSHGNLFSVNSGTPVSGIGGTTVTELVPGSTTATATLIGLSDPNALAFDSSGNLYVTNGDGTTVSEFAPGSTTATATLVGLSEPNSLAFDSSGNLYVSNYGNNTVSKFAPGSTTAMATLTGFSAPLALVVDSSGNLYVANNGNNTVSKFAPGGTTPSATYSTGSIAPYYLAVSPGGYLYVLDSNGTLFFNSTVLEFAPGSTTSPITLIGLSRPEALDIGPNGNLYVGNAGQGAVSEFVPGATAASTTFTGLNGAYAVAVNSNGYLFVGNAGNVSEFAPSATTPTTTVFGDLDFPISITLDSSGNLYVANESNTLSKFAPGSTVASTTFSAATGGATNLATDASGNLYIANSIAGTVSKYAPGTTTPSATFAGLSSPYLLAVSSDGYLYFSTSNGGLKVNEFAPGSTTATATISAFSGIGALTVDSSGNLYVANGSFNGTVSKYSPGSTTPSAIFTGLENPDALAFDSSGDLYVANKGANTVSEFAPGSTTATTTFTGLSQPNELVVDSNGYLYVENSAAGNLTEFGPGSETPLATWFADVTNSYALLLAIDSHGNLYVANGDDNSLVEFSPTSAAAGGVVIQSSVESRPMLIGGTNGTPVAGINLTSAELAQIETTASGSITIGDSQQTGNITFSTATPATTAGASLNVIQSTSGGGQIILDDGAGTATALSGNGGNISLTAGTGGIVALAASNSTAEIATTGASVTLFTAGPIGSSTNRIQFADDANTAQQIVSIGSTSIQPSSVYLDGLGSLTLGSISGYSSNPTIDVTARTNLVVDVGATINSGTGPLKLGADLTTAETGDNGVGTLSIDAGATVTTTGTITLRGADVSVDTSSNPAVVGGQRFLSTTASVVFSGFTQPGAMAFDSSGDLYVANYAASGTVTEFAPGSTTAKATYSAGISYPTALAFDSSGNLYVANYGTSTVEEFAPGNTTSSATYSSGIGHPEALAIDASGNLYVANLTGSTVVRFVPGSTTVSATYSTGLNTIYSLAVDPSGNLYVPSYLNNTVTEFAAGTTMSIATYATGLSEPDQVKFDSHGNLYVANAGNSTVSMFAPGSTTPSLTYSTGLSQPHGLAFDSNGDLYVGNYGNTTIVEYPYGSTSPATTLTGVNHAEYLAFDSSGNLYCSNAGGTTVSEFSPTGVIAEAAKVVIQSSVESRPMQVGGTNGTPVAGINLTSAELAQILTTASGTVTIGDTNQTGNITFVTATPATTAGAALNVIQSAGSTGTILLDDASGTGTGLDGNGGTVTFSPGTGGIETNLYGTGTPLATNGFTASGTMLNFALNFAPNIGTQLTVINNTATPAASNQISGAFSNLAQGSTYSTTYLGTPYYFQANYQGGDGNDLVLTDVTGPATQLIVTLQPPATVAAGSPFGFTVTAEDAEGNVASGFAGSETVALANNPGGSTLGGTLVVGASGGIAIFSGLMLNQAGSGYTLQVHSGMLTSAPSNPITVTSSYSGPLALMLDAGITNYSTTFQPGGVAVENTSGVTIDDNSNISGATIQIVSLRDGANESLSVNTGVTGIMKSYNAATGMLTLMGSASINAYESVLETITYKDSAAVPNTATRNIQFTVTDANNQKSNVALATVSFIGAYTEAAGPASVANPTLVIDPNVNVNATSITSATVAISSGFVSSSEDVLGLSSQFQQNFHITLSYLVPGEVVLTGTNQTTPVEYQLELDAITYTNTSHFFSGSDLQKTFTFTIQGSSGSSAADVKTFDILPVNTNPTVTTTTGPLNYTALSGPQLVDPGVTVTDPDPLNISGATVSISSGFATAQDTLAETVSLPANVSASYSSSTGVLTLSGTASQSQYQALLAGVAYTNNGLGLNSRTITFAVNSNSLRSNVAGNTQYTKVISFTSPTVARFDFNSGGASAAPGFVGVGPSRSFNLSSGYGFSDAVTNFAPFTVSAVENLAGVSSTYAPMYEDGIVSPTNSPQDFTLSTTVGTSYDLRVYVGNPNLSLHGIQVTVYTGSLTNLQQTQIGQSTVISTTAGGSNAFVAVEIDNLTAGGVTTVAGSEITVVIRSTTGSVYTEGLDVALHGDLPAIAHQDPAGGVAPAGNPPVAALTSSQLQPIVAQAIADWAAAGITPAQISMLRSTQFDITNLKGQGALALTGSTGDTNTVQIDSTADGYGWFVDPTVADQPAANQMDLLTVVTHELGHVLGLPDVSAALLPNDLMDTELPTGVRRLPSAADLAAIQSGSFTASANAAPISSGTPVAMIAETADAPPNAGGVPQPLAPIAAWAINAATDNADLDDDGFSVSMSELDAYFSQLG